jgi:thioredoxin-like negative regulator of GroEL
MTEFIEEMNDSNFEQVVLESKRRVEVIALLRSTWPYLQARSQKA